MRTLLFLFLASLGCFIRPPSVLGAEVTPGEDVVVYWGMEENTRNERVVLRMARQNSGATPPEVAYHLESLLPGTGAWELFGEGYLRQCAGAAPSSLAQMLEAARRRWQNFEHDKGRAILEQAIDTLACQDQPTRRDLVGLFFELALIELAAGNELAAQTAFLQVLSVDPSFPWPDEHPPSYREAFEHARRTLVELGTTDVVFDVEPGEWRDMQLDGVDLSFRPRQVISLPPGLHVLSSPRLEGGLVLFVGRQDLAVTTAAGRMELVKTLEQPPGGTLHSLDVSILQELAVRLGAAGVHLVELQAERCRGARFDASSGRFADPWVGLR